MGPRRCRPCTGSTASRLSWARGTPPSLTKTCVLVLRTPSTRSPWRPTRSIWGRARARNNRHDRRHQAATYPGSARLPCPFSTHSPRFITRRSPITSWKPIDHIGAAQPKRAFLIAVNAATTDPAYPREIVALDATMQLIQHYTADHRDLVLSDPSTPWPSAPYSKPSSASGGTRQPS